MADNDPLDLFDDLPQQPKKVEVPAFDRGSWAEFQARRSAAAPQGPKDRGRDETYPGTFGSPPSGEKRGIATSEMTKPALPDPAGPATPCPRPYSPSPSPYVASYRCRVGGGDACYSDDAGRTHFCAVHRPAGFLPGKR